MQSVLSEFTGSSESVYTVHNVDALKKIIRCVTITSSMVASKSSDTSNDSKQKQVEKQIETDLEGDIKAGTITPATGGKAVDDDWE